MHTDVSYKSLTNKTDHCPDVLCLLLIFLKYIWLLEITLFLPIACLSLTVRQRKQQFWFLNRVQPGECYHLFTKAREMTLADYPLPEILRTRLDEVILQIKILQLGKTKPFLERVMDPPDPRAVELSIKVRCIMNHMRELISSELTYFSVFFIHSVLRCKLSQQ